MVPEARAGDVRVLASAGDDLTAGRQAGQTIDDHLLKALDFRAPWFASEGWTERVPRSTLDVSGDPFKVLSLVLGPVERFEVFTQRTDRKQRPDKVHRCVLLRQVLGPQSGGR